VNGARPIFCGEIHYPRIPREYWRARLDMARSMGLTAVSTYVFWNVHELREGVYDFSGGNDVAEFVRTAGAAGLDVVLRPGPYVCAEWDLGGLPAWLLRDETIRLRTADDAYMGPVRRWLKRLGEELAPLLQPRSGPIVAVQLENEYGAYAAQFDRLECAAYLRALREALYDAGFDGVPMYTIDQPGHLRDGALEDLPAAITFAPGDARAQFAVLRELRPDGPLLCGEYWAGWFDRWGEPHASVDLDAQRRDLEWMLGSGICVNVYMFCGGTTFGFWNGANAFDPSPYQPVVSSYDYQAALDEAGRPTSKFFAFREIAARLCAQSLPEVPPPPATRTVPPFTLTQRAPVAAAFAPAVESPEALTMEAIGHPYGYVCYRTEIQGPVQATLAFAGVRDYAVVALQGRVVAHLDRRLSQSSVAIAIGRERAQLDVLVENGGRINYGPRLSGERKGITSSVFLNGAELRNWKIFPVLPGPPTESFDRAPVAGPAFFRGVFDLDEPRDTFFDVRDLRKGALWINGRCAGRFWEIGPSRSLYVPAPWLQAGKNEAVALELFERTADPVLCGCCDPVLCSP
jgi:beta-galactosidase